MKKLLLVIAVCFAFIGCYKESDVMLGKWVLPSTKDPSQFEGFVLKPHGKASSVNLGTLKYEKWHVTEGKLVLNGKDSGAGFAVDVQDIYTILSVNDTFLVLLPIGESQSISYTRQN